VGANDTGVAGHMVGDQRVDAHAFLQSEVFAAMPGVDGMDLRFDTLTIAAGVLQAVDVKLVEHRQGGRGIGDRIVGGVQRLGPQEVPRRRHKRRVAEAGHLRYLPQTHVGAHGDDAGKDMTRVGFLFHVTAQNVGEGTQKASLSGYEPQEVRDPDARQLPVTEC
jgi:hypothetical protein